MPYEPDPIDYGADPVASAGFQNDLGSGILVGGSLFGGGGLGGSNSIGGGASTGTGSSDGTSSGGGKGSAGLDGGPVLPDSLTRYSASLQYLNYQQSTRDNSLRNTFVRWNHRYNGHRESTKFNYLVQQTIVNCNSLFQTFLTSWNYLAIAEADIYPTSADIILYNYVREQIEFKEWLLIKGIDVRWYE